MRRLSSRSGSEFAGIQARAKRLSRIKENDEENMDDDNSNNEYRSGDGSNTYNFGSMFGDSDFGPLPPIGSVMCSRSSPPSYIYIYLFHLLYYLFIIFL